MNKDYVSPRALNYAFYPDDYFASSILNVTNSLNVLDSATPIVSRTLIILRSLSFAVSIPTFGLSIVGMLAYDWIRGWKQKKEDLAAIAALFIQPWLIFLRALDGKISGEVLC